MKRNTSGAFTLIEILIGILITSMVLIAAFSTLTFVGASKVRLIESSTIKKQAFYMGEKFFDLVKKGGNIDYEEYWNRSSFDTSNYASGHYQNDSGFGNFGDGGILGSSNYGSNMYYCLSPNGSFMGTGGCLLSNNSEGGASLRMQRYGQYAEQFIDRNSDRDTDGGDEDGNGYIVGDDDDYYLGIGPSAFSGSKVQELYLLNTQTQERTLFRWNIERDSYAPSGSSCSSGQNFSGSGCIGNVQMLKLVGKDAGNNHANSGPAYGDGKIDTWLIHPDFDTVTGTGTIYGSNSNNYWQNIFPDTVHVSRLEFHLYPNKEQEYSWRDTSPDIEVASYVQIHMTLEPSWKLKRKMKGSGGSVDLTTTISLSDISLQ